MPAIKKTSIRKIKENVKIDDVFEWLGSKVTHRGRSTMAFCPFCNDATSHNPGCSLDIENGLYHCFVCQRSGDLITAVEEHEECSFPEAIELLSKQFNIPLEYDAVRDPESESRRKKLVSALEAANALFIKQRSFHQFQDFLDSRNIGIDAVNTFELGISLYSEAPNTVAKLLESFDAKTLIDAGLCYKNEHGDLILLLKNRITYPTRTVTGTLVGFGGRDITGKSPAKYKNSPETEIFKKRDILYGMDKARKAISKEKKAIVCEGYMDTIALQTHGFPYSVGAMGTALTEANLSYLSRFSDTIYLSLDGDLAGVAAAMRVARLIPRDFSSDVKVMSIPLKEIDAIGEPDGKMKIVKTIVKSNGVKTWLVADPKDPDEFFNQKHNTTELFRSYMNDAEDIYIFCVEHIISDDIDLLDAEFASDEPDQRRIADIKTAASKKVSDFMSDVVLSVDVNTRMVIADFVIESLRLVETASQLEMQWEKQVKNNAYSKANKKVSEAAPVFASASTKIEDLIIGSLFFHPDVRGTLKMSSDTVKDVFTSPVRKKIFMELDKKLGENKNPHEIADSFEENETRELARILTSDAVMRAKDELGQETVKMICIEAEKSALQHAIDVESESAVPNLMRIISLKSKLANM